MAAAQKENAKAVAEGRCKILQGDVSQLPFPENNFDLITAFETIYFWPGPLESFRQVHKVLKPDGRFMIVCESDGEKPDDQKWLDMVDGMKLFNKEELKKILLEAGFSSVVTHHNLQKHYLCLIARK